MSDPASRHFHVALEITPPRSAGGARSVLLRRARRLGDRPDRLHVIQRSDRLSSLDASIELRAAGLHPVWHLATRGHTRDEIDAEIDRALAAGIDSVLCIRGEHTAKDEPEAPLIREVVASIVARAPDMRVGVTLNPYLNSDRLLPNLFAKLDAGACFVQTQPIFVPERLFPSAERIRAHAPGTEILPMVMPLLSLEAADRIGRRLRLPLPATLLASLEKSGAGAGWAAFTDALAIFSSSGLVDGVALMTLEAEAPDDVAKRMGEVVDLL